VLLQLIHELHVHSLKFEAQLLELGLQAFLQLLGLRSILLLQLIQGLELAHIRKVVDHLYLEVLVLLDDPGMMLELLRLQFLLHHRCQVRVERRYADLLWVEVQQLVLVDL